MLDQTQTAVAGLRRVLGVLDVPVGPPPAPNPQRLPEGRFSIDIDDVTFSYRSRADRALADDVVLEHVTAFIPAGQQVAVVGATGSGKTTLGRLVARFADPIAGEIRLGGVPLSQIDNAELRRRLVVVAQEPFLFDDTIAENIRFSKPERHPRRDRTDRRPARRRRLGRVAARRPRHPRRRARRLALGRRAPARRAAARGRRRPRRARARRGDVVGRRAHRGAHLAGPVTPRGGSHHDRHRPPALHRGARRPRAGARTTAASSRTATTTNWSPPAAPTAASTTPGSVATDLDAPEGDAPPECDTVSSAQGRSLRSRVLPGSMPRSARPPWYVSIATRKPSGVGYVGHGSADAGFHVERVEDTRRSAS